METPWEQRYAQRTQRMASSAIRELLKLTQLPDIISFAGGMPAPELFPVEAFRKACDHVLDTDGQFALQYSTTEGYPPLREMIVRHTARYGIDVSIENILITSGSQQALDLLGKIFINPGDRILVEGPTFLGAIQAWNSYGAEYIVVEMDEEGMKIEALEKALRSGPKFIYMMPNFQNPTGKTYSLDRRMQVIKLAAINGVPIIEDDPYGQLRYSGKHITPVWVLDSQSRSNSGEGYEGNVIYLSTFSKIFAPGIRIAWVIAPPNVIGKMVQAKQGVDLHTATFNQMAVHEVSREGFLDRHIGNLRETYQERRDLMLESIEKEFPESIKWTKPDGGLFTWATLDENIDTRDVLNAAVEKKVAFVPGVPFFPDGSGLNTMRLNFSNAQPDKIIEGIKRLGQVLKDQFY